MIVQFVHGWGFDSSIWDALATRFDRVAFAERGYFGSTGDAPPDEPHIAVTHSFGTMRVLTALPGHCRGIVAINGFDRFAQAPGFPGVPQRAISRMISSFADHPADVLDEFRRRCGSEGAAMPFERALLVSDLNALRDSDCRAEAAGCGLPVLSLQGGEDPILPLAMREAVFATASSCTRKTIATGGHLLPLTETAACAQAICAFMEQL